MPKTKRSHHRSHERRVDGDELSNQSVVSDESDQLVESKKRHRKKSSKKAKKHRSKRKQSPSESESESSDSSESSSDSSSEEEVVKRKKQKKHKKSKRRSRHEATDERKVERDDNEVEILHEPPKVHYISSDEERQHHLKSLKRADDRKKPRDVIANERGIDCKSRWDSPNDEFERKRRRESPVERVVERRVEDRYRGAEQRPAEAMRSARIERNVGIDRNERVERARQSPPPPGQRQERDRIDRRNPEPDFRRDRRDDTNQAEWRNRERPPVPEIPERYRHNKDERDLNRDRRFAGRIDAGRFGRQENERKRSVSPRMAGRGRFEERRERENPPRFNFNENRRDAREPVRGERFGHERRPDMDRPPRNDRPRNEPERNRNERDTRDRRSPRRSPERVERHRSPIRSNPFRRNKNPEEQSDFRHDGQRPDRNDRNGRNTNNGQPPPNRRRFKDKESDNENFEWGKAPPDADKKKEPTDEEPVDKEKPNFGLSGKLTEDTNKVNGVVIKYAEPQEARRPKRRWRLYPFKNDQSLNTIYIHRQSCFLIGREKKICEIAVDHPSCSKQHAALQYRLVTYERDDGSVGKRVRPYIIDLESANGTFVNNNKIDSRKYVELFEKDVLKFGFSSREYVLLHEDSNVDEDEPNYDDDDHIKTEE